jgi:hypothetical protein
MNDATIAAQARAADLAKVRRARGMTEEQRMLSGPRLFAGVCDRIREGLRDEHPDSASNAIEMLLRKRLAIVLHARKLHATR